MHNLDNQTENLKKYLENISKQKVHIVNKVEIIDKGIYIPEGGKDIIFFDESTITVSEKSNIVSPSINHLFGSLEPYADKNTYIFLLSGLGNDGTEGLEELEKTEANIYIQEDAQFPYMPKNAMKSIKKYNLINLENMNRILLMLNNQVIK